MSRKTKIIVGSSAIALLLTAAAQAAELRIEARSSTSCITLSLSSAQCTSQGKGTGGGFVVQSTLQPGGLGPPSERCAGFDIEVAFLSGSFITTFDDLSQLYGVLTFGFTCVRLDGTQKSHVEFNILGGSGRFEGASGSISQDDEGVVMNPFIFPHQTATTGTLTGTIALP